MDQYTNSIVSGSFEYDQEISALDAKYEAQKIAFAPIMFQASLALRDLGILDFLMKTRKQGATLQAIASALSLSEYGVKVLLEAGLSLRMIKQNEKNFFISKIGYYIANDELTRANMDFTQDVNYLGMFNLQDSIRNGKPEGLKVFGTWPTVYEALSELPEPIRRSWFAFDHYYSDYSFPEAIPLLFALDPKSIMDIGGNTGKFSLFCAKSNPAVEMTIVDLPGQIKDAQANIAKAGMQERVHFHPVNLLGENVILPKGFDILWMSQFLDCFSQAEISKLLHYAKEAMSEQASLFIMETFWDKQRFEASTYSLHATSLYFTAIANGNSQMYHSADMLALLDQAGFYVKQEWHEVGVSHSIYRCMKKVETK
jgi:hypothetical protein